MKKLLVVLIALFATFAWGQAGAGADQKTGTMDQSAKKAAHKKTGETTLAGCLGGSEGAYTLKHGKREIQVTSSEDLSKHVGHEVKLHGTWAKAAAAAGTETAEKGAAKKGAKTFNATSIEHVSDTCPAAGTSTGMGAHHHHKGSAAGAGAAGGAAPSATPSPSPQK